MQNFKKRSKLLIMLLLVISTSTFGATKAKYVFYFIGDGFGLNQSKAAESYIAAMRGEEETTKMEMNQFPVLGFYTTHCTNSSITDSAAAGTALATGNKTSSGTIGMDASREKSFKSVAEMARDKGMKVGLVSSVSIDHATPASFYAHQPTRGMYYEIGLDLGKSNFNYFGGGDIMKPTGNDGDQPSSIEAAKANGYRYIKDNAEFKKLAPGDDKIIAVSEKTVGGSAIPFGIDKRDSDLSLADFTRKGIELLDNKSGFFMMVEGGKIDWACHANDAATAIHEVIQFNDAIKEALEFYEKHPKETIIIVCGDHETGGMGLGFSGSGYTANYSLLENQNISYEEFNDVVNRFKESKELTFEKAMELVNKHYGLGDESRGLALSSYETEQLRDAFTQSMLSSQTRNRDKKYYSLYGSYDPLTLTAGHILAQKAGIGWTTYSHTSAPIPIRALGVGEDNFSGYFDNTDIPKKVMKLIGVTYK